LVNYGKIYHFFPLRQQTKLFFEKIFKVKKKRQTRFPLFLDKNLL